MKRLFIVSNEGLSKQSSNGRTLLNLLAGYSPNLLAQFSIHGIPDETVCDNYFQISDNDALNIFLHRKTKNKPKSETHNTSAHKNPHRNCRNMVLRDTVWMSFKWWNKDFDKFIEDFNPEVVLLQASDCPFMYAIAIRISVERNIPLIMYNSESYVLKKRIYSAAKLYSPWNYILLKRLRRQYKLFMKECSFCVYITEYLEKAYQSAYPHPNKSISLYTSYNSLSAPQDICNEQFTISYCGNLGVGRFDCIKEFAETMYKLDENSKLIICGKFPSPEQQGEICTNPIVDYRGFVTYEETQNIINNSNMIFHCENADRLENLRYAFSTKIADSLASGKPFLVYASHDYPFVQYLEKHDAAHIAGNQNELEFILNKCMTDKTYMNSKTKNALSLAEKNHNINKNAQAFQNIINTVYNSKGWLLI